MDTALASVLAAIVTVVGGIIVVVIQLRCRDDGNNNNTAVVTSQGQQQQERLSSSRQDFEAPPSPDLESMTASEHIDFHVSKDPMIYGPVFPVPIIRVDPYRELPYQRLPTWMLTTKELKFLPQDGPSCWANVPYSKSRTCMLLSEVVVPQNVLWFEHSGRMRSELLSTWTNYVVPYHTSRLCLFSEVAVLQNVSRFEINGRMSTESLRNSTNYVVLLIFKPTNNTYGFEGQSLVATIAGPGNRLQKKSLQLQARFGFNMEVEVPRRRDEEWLEITMGSFSTNTDVGKREDDYVDVGLLACHNGNSRMGGLVVAGIQFKPFLL